jgi:hypothetical protein
MGAMNKRALAWLLLPLLVPAAASAATVTGARNLVVSEAQPGNAYFAGVDLTVAAPVAGDLAAAGASVTVSEPVGGDAMIAGGTIDVRKPVAGDLRAAGAHVTIESSVGGDLVVAAGAIDATGTPAYAYLVGGRVSLTAGANGPVRIYGANVSLAGTYAGDVTVTASDRLSLAPGTIIKGSLRYDAPQEADIPPDARIDGGIHYTGTSFLPTTQEAHTFALAGAGVFLIVRVLAALIAAGLLAGLFPAIADAVATRSLRSLPRFGLLTLLGFAVGVATPILIVLLAVTFAGIGVAIVVGAAYALLIAVSYLYAGVIAGAALARRVMKRDAVLWRDAVIGMLILALVASIPFVGWIVLIVLWAAAAGSVVSIVYSAAFPHEDGLTAS